MIMRENSLFSAGLAIGTSGEDHQFMNRDASCADLLKAEYFRRKALNPRYSERGFARSICVSPGFLKLLFQGKKNLSEKRASEIADRLNWTELKKIQFCRSIRKKRLRRHRHLKTEEFSHISDWFNFAILEILKTSRTASATEIGKRLGVDQVDVNFALNNLQEKGLLKFSDGRFLVEDQYEVPSLPSESIKKYHRQILELALRSLDAQNFSGRDFRGLCVAFDTSRLQEAKMAIEKFVFEFNRQFSSGHLSSVYQLHLEFFRLDEGG